MQSFQDAERMISLGAPRERVRITGNMKFDADVSACGGELTELKGLIGIADDDVLLVAGSTHRGEEAIILETVKELSTEFPRLKLLIAPRHIERTKEVEEAVRSSGLEPVRFSSTPFQPCCPRPLLSLSR